jgi:hypothetical protein
MDESSNKLSVLVFSCNSDLWEIIFIYEMKISHSSSINEIYRRMHQFSLFIQKNIFFLLTSHLLFPQPTDCHPKSEPQETWA